MGRANPRVHLRADYFKPSLFDRRPLCLWVGRAGRTWREQQHWDTTAISEHVTCRYCIEYIPRDKWTDDQRKLKERIWK